MKCPWDTWRKAYGVHPPRDGWYACATGIEWRRKEADRARWKMESEERCPRRPLHFKASERPKDIGFLQRRSGSPLMMLLMATTMLAGPGGFDADEK